MFEKFDESHEDQQRSEQDIVRPVVNDVYHAPGKTSEELTAAVDEQTQFNGKVMRKRSILSIPRETITLDDMTTGDHLLIATKIPSQNGAYFNIFKSKPNGVPDILLGCLRGDKKLRCFRFYPLDEETPSFVIQYTGEYQQIHPREFIVNLLQSATRPEEIVIEAIPPVKKDGKFVLNFEGKAKIASIKNCVLATAKTHKKCLLFAKQTNESYALDVKSPLSITEGFAIACASLNNGSFQH